MPHASSREAATAIDRYRRFAARHAVAHRLHGLTPTAKCCHRFAIQTANGPLFQALFSITDLLATGHHVADVAPWVGNSPAVIWEHYAMATEENRRRTAAIILAGLLAPVESHNEPKTPAEMIYDEKCGPIGG